MGSREGSFQGWGRGIGSFSAFRKYVLGRGYPVGHLLIDCERQAEILPPPTIISKAVLRRNQKLVGRQWIIAGQGGRWHDRGSFRSHMNCLRSAGKAHIEVGI